MLSVFCRKIVAHRIFATCHAPSDIFAEMDEICITARVARAIPDFQVRSELLQDALQFDVNLVYLRDLKVHNFFSEIQPLMRSDCSGH